MGTLLYNPDRKGKDQLIAEFVVRNEIYTEIMKDLESSPMKYPEQHYLIVGQRGTGKTTLLNRIRYGIEDSKKLNAYLIPVIFSEEQYHITDLGNLWESIGIYLEDSYGFQGISQEIETLIGKGDFEELSFDILEKYLKKYKKKIVLLLDNLGDLLKKLEKNEIRRFREILQTKPELRLIAGSPFYLEATIDYHQPFYEFFKIIHLDGLTQLETERLLLKLGEMNNELAKIQSIVKETPERIAVLRMLTGGVPRTIALMFKIFVDSNDESSVKDLERILDAVTPLYKHRMDDLPAQQQKIVHAVAINWDAIPVKELKDKVRIEGKIVSAQLKQLEKNQIIEKIETSTKNHLYLLKERFFNIWYLMRYGRKDDKQRVVWLIRFLESWCSSDDLKTRILSYVNRIKSNQLDKETVEFFGQVYAGLKNLDADDRVLLKVSTPKSISSNIILSEKELKNAITQKIAASEWNDILQLIQDHNHFDNTLKAMIFLVTWGAARSSRKHPLLINIFKKINVQKKNRTIHLTAVEFEVFKGLYTQMLIDEINNGIKDQNIFLDSIRFLLELVSLNQTINDPGDGLNLIFYTLLAHRQYNLLNKLFSENEIIPLMEIFKPVYYTLVYLKNGPKSNEFLKAGPELQESIKAILDKVDSFRKSMKIDKIEPI